MSDSPNTTPEPQAAACEQQHHHDGHAGCCGHDHSHAHDHGSGSCGHDHSHGNNDTEWTRQFFLMLECIVLFLAGIIAVWFFASGRIDIYLQGYLRYLSLAGGLAVMVMGLFNWFTRHQSVTCCGGHEHDHDAEDGHHHSHEGSASGRGASLLCIAGAVGAAAALTPDAYTAVYLQNKEMAQRMNRGAASAPVSEAVANSKTGAGGIDQERFDKYATKNADGAYILDVINLAYAGSDSAYVDFLAGRAVESSGQIVKDQITPGPGHYRIYLLQVNCCMSDARPFSIPVLLTDERAEPRENGWHRLNGKLDFVNERGVKMARIRDATATPIPIPRPNQSGFMGMYK